MIPNVKPYIPEEDIPLILHDIEEVLKSRRLVLGKNLASFEEEFRTYMGTKFAVGTNSASLGLQILFQYFDVKDKEVILPSLNFISVANAVIWAGGKPVFCDTEKNSLSPSLKQIEDKITDKTAGVVLTHITGHISPDFFEVKKFCKDKMLFLIEDASHAHGSEINGKKAGSLANAAVFSLFATKPITTGTGGMITTDNPKIYEYAISARHQGQGKNLQDCKTIGGGWHLNEIPAILGRHQLKHLDEWLLKRNSIAKRYDDAFKNHSKISLLTSVGKSVHYKYQILLNEDVDKQDFINKLEAEGIKCGQVYNPPIHLQPVYQSKYNYKRGAFPNTELTCDRLVALPIFIEMSEAEQTKVIDTVLKILE